MLILENAQLCFFPDPSDFETPRFEHAMFEENILPQFIADVSYTTHGSRVIYFMHKSSSVEFLIG